MKYSRQIGFSTIEVLLAASILVVIVTALIGGVIYGRESTLLAGQRNRATFLAEEGLEAVRNIRDNSYASLTIGTHGLIISGNKWILSGTSDTTDIFVRQIIIANAGTNRLQVTSTVTWQQDLQRSGAVSLVTNLDNWIPVVAADCTSFCQSVGNFTVGTCRGSPGACNNHHETYEAGGDIYCTGGPSANTCCCL